MKAITLVVMVTANAKCLKMFAKWPQHLEKESFKLKTSHDDIRKSVQLKYIKGPQNMDMTCHEIVKVIKLLLCPDKQTKYSFIHLS